MSLPSASIPEKPAPAQFSNMPSSQTAQPAVRQSQFQPIELPPVEKFKPSRPFSLGKLVLGGFNLVFAVITLGLSVGVITQFYYFDAWLGAIIMAAAVAEDITLMARRSIYRPIHPGAHVGVHLILWILALLATVSLAFSLSYTLADWSVDANCSDSNFDYYNGESYVYCGFDTFTSLGQANRYFHLLESLVAFSVLLTVAHFVLFVLACIETDRRRKYGKLTKVVYLVASDGPADGRTYYTQVASPQAAAAVRRQSQIAHPAPAQVRGPTGGETAAAAAPGSEAYGYYSPAPAGAPHAGGSAAGSLSLKTGGPSYA
ncbi:hypothetical protein M406DRAFT_350271 [Cryphonectria parasitica EP155]|uniref:MARVEL domain-containing protein n=1 Tax=Cryphonectria parasitica (strain ATCC 38755 / EP155) TaxID=660469 RepID=A0A9P4Y5N2_CRYP1|nr:uncharacterized protein M406DRAFT_350271 [Cryphonectria parasitica EP155]KAF3766812.1 hypothetical protein M406DRAFT_350271 [Cryphonectria parasitica EP155]